MKTAVIFGVTGQDGSYLSEFLLAQNYAVIGVKRRSSSRNDLRIQHLIGQKNFVVETGDVTDFASVLKIICDYAPEEVYNLAAQSHVKISFDQPIATTDSTYIGCLNILEAIKLHQASVMRQQIRFYQASSSEMFGTSVSSDGYQRESTVMLPCSPYAIAKLAAHHLCRVYRAQGIFACSGILFNHESPRRGEEFVTKKVTQFVAKGAILRSVPLFSRLSLGNVDAKRDWGHARDYVEAMWLMLQQNFPDDFVIATGQTRSVRELVDTAFAVQGIESIDAWDYIDLDASLHRPCEVPMLRGDPTKARLKLGWTPKTTFSELIKEMVEYDFQIEQRRVSDANPHS